MTCTGVEPGTIVTLPGTTCIPSPATATGIVKCAEITPGTLPSNPIVAVTDPAGNTIKTTIPYVKDTTAPTAPTCLSQPDKTVVCTGVTPGDIITIPGTTCIPTPASATGIVNCTLINPNDPTPTGPAIATDPAGNKTPTPIIPDTDGDGTGNNVDNDDDNDGIIDDIENKGPNNGDANGDGTLDSLQVNVVTMPTSSGGSYVTLEFDLPIGCFVSPNGAFTILESSQYPDTSYDYPFGLASFKIKCTKQIKVTTYWHGITDLNKDGWEYRKFYNSDKYTPWTVVTGHKVIGGKTIATATYTLSDNEAGDLDSASGIILDLTGPAKKTPMINQIANTIRTGAIENYSIVFYILGLIILASLATKKSKETQE